MMQDNQTLQSWQTQTRAGNNDFAKHNLPKALNHYLKAIELAEALFAHSEDPKGAVAALIVSHQNLADLYVQENEVLMAEVELKNIHQKLSLLLSKAKPDAPNLDALMWGVSKTYVALVTHMKKHSNEMTTEPPALPNLFKTTFKKALN